MDDSRGLAVEEVRPLNGFGLACSNNKDSVPVLEMGGDLRRFRPRPPQKKRLCVLGLKYLLFEPAINICSTITALEVMGMWSKIFYRDFSERASPRGQEFLIISVFFDRVRAEKPRTSILPKTSSHTGVLGEDQRWHSNFLRIRS